MLVRDRSILLVEDNPDDEKLAIPALRKDGIARELAVARNGVEAFDYLFGTGEGARRDAGVMPAVVPLDLKLPRLNGLEILERLRADPRTSPVPVAVLTTSREEQDILKSCNLRVNSYVRKPVDCNRFTEAVKHPGLDWLLLNDVPPRDFRVGGS